MKIAVAGLWHLGTVTAGCLASAGHDVIGLDEDAALIARLNAGELPVAEPGLQEIIETELASVRLRFSDSFAEAAGAEVARSSSRQHCSTSRRWDRNSQQPHR